jgi:hypothetical protein
LAGFLFLEQDRSSHCQREEHEISTVQSCVEIKMLCIGL